MDQQIFRPVSVPENFNRWSVPIRMGLLIGVISAVLNTMNFMFVMPKNPIGFFIFTIVNFIIAVILYGVAAAQQRKAMGGFINFGEAFMAVMIAVVISTAISTIWGLIYMKWIDPQMGDKIKESTMSFMEKMKVPQEKIDEQMKNVDKQIADGTNPVTLLWQYIKSLLIFGIIGLIIAAIVQRKPKQEMR